MPRRAACILLTVLAAAGCGDNPAPPSPSPGPGTGETITGRERIGWDQPAGGVGELATFRYAIYVDGVRSEIAEVTCASTPEAGAFPCSGRLPSMTTGVHTLELAAFTLIDALRESAKSPTLRVTVTGATPGVPSPAAWVDGPAGTTADGVSLFVERITDGLRRPSDAAFTPDGTLFIAERFGRVRVVRAGRLQASPALVLDDVTFEGGLVALAISPDFERTRQVFTLSIHTSPAGDLYRLSRYRELNGVFAQRAVLHESPAPPAATAAMRIGPDGLLYLALGAASSASATAPFAYDGKILRLDRNGSAPQERGVGVPALSAGHVSPRALAWAPDGALLWIADGNAEGREWISAVDGSRTAAVDRLQKTAPVAAWSLPDGARTSALTFYRGARSAAFSGNLFVASAPAQRILRVRFDSDPRRVLSTESLLENSVGPIHVVLEGPDGAIYFCTETELGRISAGDGVR